jgi:hypothetical protein
VAASEREIQQLDFKAIRFKEAIAKHMENLEEMISKEEDEALRLVSMVES